MRIVFFGTADFAVPSLKALLAADNEVVAVVTQPDKPQGRGMQLAASAVKKAAIELGLEVLQPKRVRSPKFIEEIRSLSPDLLALAAFGQIVPQQLLDIPRLGPINVHGSLLPAYRGAAPIQRAIMAGETVTGVTTMWMDATLDTGDILLKAEVPILPEDTTGSLFPRIAQTGAELLIQTIAKLDAGTLERIPQVDSEATNSPKIEPGDGEVVWAEAAATTVNRIRGVTPKPGAFTWFRGKKLKIWSAIALSGPVEGLPGTIQSYIKKPAGLLVCAGKDTGVILLEVQPESGKRMNADAWARGARVNIGDRLILE